MSAFNYAHLKQIRGIGSKRLEMITSILEENNLSVDDMFKMSAPEIKKQFKLPTPVAEAIATTQPEQKPQPTDPLANKGIRILKPNNTDYPNRLKAVLNDKTPAELYVWGNLDLLNRPSVGFCGSRSVTDKGLEVTADTAEQIAKLGWVVVSGHAKGVDLTAHRVALENGAGTIIVAPQGILDFKLRRELKQIAKSEQLLIVSEFKPEAGWAVGRAMQRNKTIIGLSDVMILVEARLEGGTFKAGEQALTLKQPLFVAEYEIPGEKAAGNAYFLQRGAISIRKSTDTGKANLKYLRDLVEKRSQNIKLSAPPEQLRLIPE